MSGVDLFDQLEERVVGIADRWVPSVTGVRSGRAVGSGFVLAPDRVVTNAHNVDGAPTTVTFVDGRAEEATAAAVDADLDLAVLEVDTAGLAAVEWPRTSPAAGSVDESLRAGRLVVAVAAPGGAPRTTVGWVSGTGRSFRGPGGRRISGAVEHTAPLARGSSGGPLLDGKGELVGINTHRLTGGFYLALRASVGLVDHLRLLATGSSPSRPRLGVAVAPPHVARSLRAAVGLEERQGLLVRDVQEGSPAAAAGLRKGDLLVAAEGQEIGTVDDLHAAVDRCARGASLALGVVRGDDELDVSVTFAEGGDQ
jgi:serine protease Do